MKINTINMNVIIAVATSVKAGIEKVWQYWTAPEHIMQWNNASPEWHTSYAENDLQAGGKFLFRMEAKDRSFGFDFSGVYDAIMENKLIAYTLDDGRKVIINFSEEGTTTRIMEEFEAETENPTELQKAGWQAILDNFRKHVENN